jgi:16S rRNA (guanine966-N2)-methyltransferase
MILPGCGTYAIDRLGNGLSRPWTGVPHMRVIAGTLGGRRFMPVPGHETRPTADRVREAVFSRLESRYELQDIEVLDLFAGTGALGIEALSRGARAVVAVEHNRRAARVLVENMRSLGLEGRSEVKVLDVDRFLDDAAEQGRRFCGIFVDPPYGTGAAERTLEKIAALGLVESGGWVTIESARSEEFPERLGELSRVRADRYGDTLVTLYEVSQ